VPAGWAEVADGTDVVAAIAGLEVDLALLDVNMPGLTGIDAAARLSASRPEVAVLMLTMFDDDASVFAALRAGARGYVLKDSGRDGRLRAIRAVAGPSRPSCRSGTAPEAGAPAAGHRDRKGAELNAGR
jgi:DNA-binding NarL/FixJ family response regulator